MNSQPIFVNIPKNNYSSYRQTQQAYTSNIKNIYNMNHPTYKRLGNSEWLILFDVRSQRNYYYNEITKTSQWEYPLKPNPTNIKNSRYSKINSLNKENKLNNNNHVSQTSKNVYPKKINQHANPLIVQNNNKREQFHPQTIKLKQNSYSQPTNPSNQNVYNKTNINVDQCQVIPQSSTVNIREDQSKLYHAQPNNMGKNRSNNPANTNYGNNLNRSQIFQPATTNHNLNDSNIRPTNSKPPYNKTQFPLQRDNQNILINHNNQINSISSTNEPFVNNINKSPYQISNKSNLNRPEYNPYSELCSSLDVNKVSGTNSSVNKRDPKSIKIANAQSIKELMSRNKICADCTKKNPMWISSNIGCVICTKCCSCHRSLGTDVSKIKSLKLDKITNETLANAIGNEEINEEYEYCVPSDFMKPHETSPNPIRKKYISAKYKDQIFRKKDGLMRWPPIYADPKFQKGNSIFTNEGIISIHLRYMEKCNESIYLSFECGEELIKSKIIKPSNYKKYVDHLKLKVKSICNPINIKMYSNGYIRNKLIGEGEIMINDLPNDLKHLFFESEDVPLTVQFKGKMVNMILNFHSI